MFVTSCVWAGWRWAGGEDRWTDYGCDNSIYLLTDCPVVDLCYGENKKMKHLYSEYLLCTVRIQK